MLLKPGQVCKYSANCPYVRDGIDFCQGTNPNRNTEFKCNFIKEDGSFINTGYLRNSLDVTGKMKVIME